MARPRISIMVMTEGEPDAPVRSYSVPWYTPRLAIIASILVIVLLILTSTLMVYFYSASREVEALREEMRTMNTAVGKLEALQRELVYHRDFTRRIAGLLGISVPDFADSALAAMAAGRLPASASDSFGIAEVEDGEDRMGEVGVSVLSTPPDPNNRPRGMPLAGRISRGFAPHQGNPELRHNGIDLAAREGTPVLVTADGTVEFAGEDPIFGLLIIVDHGNGFRTSYGHNSLMLVKAGDKVQRGERIASSGNTGVSTAPHLHYEISENGAPMDPTGFLGR